MQQVSRQQVFAQAAKKLRQDFEELSTVPHAGLKGHEAEEIVRRFLKEHLPKRFDVGSGFVIDSLDNISKQTDVIIYDALNCPVYRASDVAAIIPSDNVAAIVEVKSRLDKDAMRLAFENIRAVKSLVKAKPPNLPFPVTTQTFGALFAFSSPLTSEKLLEHYADFVKSYELDRHIDVVFVLDRLLLGLFVKMPGILGWSYLTLEGFGSGSQGEGAHIAASLINVGGNGLDMFLRVLLGQLMHFRGMVPHPGFNWATPGDGQPMLKYLATVMWETDPGLQEKKLKEYAEQVQVEFPGSPPGALRTHPRDTTKNHQNQEPPSVIYLPYERTAPITASSAESGPDEGVTG